MKYFKIISLLISFLLMALPVLNGKVSQAEADRLGQDLTPLGAEQAANADSSIPAWEGGITRAPAGYSVGMHHPDPYSDDQPVLVITAANMDQHLDKIPAGNQALLKAYDTYKMKIYPSRRSASYPQRIYDATKQCAVNAELIDDGRGVHGAIIGVPFPIPSDPREVMWNHLLRYRGDQAVRKISQAAPLRNGAYTLVNFETEFLFKYSLPGMTEENLENTIFFFKQEVTAPARLAGTILLVHETLDQIREPRKAWVYNAGQRRVRRAPNVAYDNPGTASDGMRTSDNLDMFNGALDRYNWKLLGKKEMYIPYNSYTLHSDKTKVADILQPNHINQDLARYELHRVWIVEATLKEGTRHIYARRVFYVDEDSWQIMVSDQYDGRGELWRVSEGHSVNYYEVPTFWTTLEVHTDLIAGRYLAMGMDNENDMYDFSIERKEADYTPSSLRRSGRR